MAAFDTAASHLGAKPKKPTTPHKPLKEFHAKELHDGSYHVTMHHGYDEMGGPTKPHTEGSADDLDGVHDHLEEHMGYPNDGEEPGEKKEEKESKAEKKEEGHK